MCDGVGWARQYVLLSVVGIFVVDAIFQVTRINHDLQTTKSRRLSYLRFGGSSFLFVVKKRSFGSTSIRYSVAVVGTHKAQQQYSTVHFVV